MDNNVKKFLKAVPVLAAGIVIGAVATDREKVKNALIYGCDTVMDWAEYLLLKTGIFEEEIDILEDMVSKEDEDDFDFEDFDGPEEMIPEEDEMAEDTDTTPMEKGNWGATYRPIKCISTRMHLVGIVT